MSVKLRTIYGIDPESQGNAFFWPKSQGKRDEMMTAKRGEPAVYQSTYMCNPGSREGTIFLEKDFNDYAPPPNLAMGYEDPKIREYLSNFQHVVCSWDTAFEATSDADFTVCVTAGFIPCNQYHRGESEQEYGPCEDHYDVIILNVYRDKVEWGDLTLTFREQHRRWRPAVHVVEKKGSGISLYQSLVRAGIEVVGVDVQESKRARAIDGTGAGSVQGWFKRHRVRVPFADSGVDWVGPFKQELKNFSGGDGGRDDQVDATVHLVNYAIKEGTGVAILPTGWNPDVQNWHMAGAGPDQWLPSDNIQALAPGQLIDRNWQLMAGLGEFAQDPFEMTCDRCLHMGKPSCPYHPITMLAFDACGAFASKVEQQQAIFR